MEYTLKEMIGSIGLSDLMKMKDDLRTGGENILMLIDNRIKEEIKKQNCFCTVCAKKIEDEHSKLSLNLKHDEQEKDAFFCGMDCMDYFMEELKKVRGTGEVKE